MDSSQEYRAPREPGPQTRVRACVATGPRGRGPGGSPGPLCSSPGPAVAMRPREAQNHWAGAASKV